MSRFSFPSLVLLTAAVALTGTFLCESSALAQNAENVKIVTADGVKLHAVFYASEKKNSPTVIMLHPIGDGKSSKSQDWKGLAEALNKAHYSVIMFDFRGHGESTSLDDAKLFWSKAVNGTHVKVKDKKDEAIEVKDYIKAGGAYLPVLCNDIAAVRSYLDRRNDDSKDCNTSSLIVIGAESGGTLGAIWMNSEMYRYKYMPPAGFTGFNQKFLERNSEGKDIIGAVFLSVSPTLEKRKMQVSKLLNTSCKANGTAALFMYGEDDAPAKTLAKSLEDALKTKNSKKHDYIGAYKLETNLSGVKLLQKGLKANELIVKYLDNVAEERKNDRVDRDFMNTYFMWQNPQNTKTWLQSRNRKADKNINFDDFSKFIP